MPLVLTYQADVAAKSTESTFFFLFWFFPFLLSSLTFENNQANNYSNNKKNS